MTLIERLSSNHLPSTSQTFLCPFAGPFAAFVKTLGQPANVAALRMNTDNTTATPTTRRPLNSRCPLLVPPSAIDVERVVLSKALLTLLARISNNIEAHQTKHPPPGR